MWILPAQLSSAFALDTPVSKLASSELLADRAASSLIQRSKPSPSRTWLQRFKRGSFPRLQSGAICEASREKRFTEWWTSSVAGTLANLGVPPENGSEKPIPATSGPTSGRRSEQSTLELFSSRTSKATFRLDSPQSSAIWKKMVTRRRGDYSLRQKLALPTGASGSLSWGTPRVTTNGGSPSPQCTGRGSRLEDQVAMAWPTPAAQETGWKNITIVDKEGFPPDHFHQRLYDKDSGRKVQLGLSQAVSLWPEERGVQNWPTPAARDYRTPYAETGLVRADGKPRLDLLPDAVRYETLFCRKAASGPSSPPTPAGPQDPENLSTDGNPPEQWPTPRAYSFAESHQPGLTPLDIRVRGLYQDNPRYWASPHANCTTGAGNQGRQGGENLQTQAKGKLNPRWVETLMGLPIGWTTPSCADLAIVVSMNSGSSATGSCPQPQSGPSESSQPSSAGST